MSHFTVLVIGDDPEKQLAPFHEFECTGTDDEYVVDVDVTAEKRAAYATDTSRRLADPGGGLHRPYDAEFYRDPTEAEHDLMGRGRDGRPVTHGMGGGHGLSWDSRDWKDGRGYRTRIQFIPEGWTEIKVPMAQLMTFTEYCIEYCGLHAVNASGVIYLTEEHKYNYVLLRDGEVIKAVNRTNPNSKWDWYQIGGRWAGAFILKEMNGGGTRGLAPGQYPYTKADRDPYELANESAGGRTRVDQARKGDIDWEAMMVDARAIAIGDWDKAQSVFNSDGNKFELLFLDIHDGETRDQYAMRKARWAPYAMLSRGQWYEKGKMGWWGMSFNEKEQADWDTEFVKLLGGLADDTLLTLVDCHI